jgi:hypothetical protein
LRLFAVLLGFFSTPPDPEAVAGVGFDGGIRGVLISSMATQMSMTKAVSVRESMQKLARPKRYKLTGEAFSSRCQKVGKT